MNISDLYKYICMLTVPSVFMETLIIFKQYLKQKLYKKVFFVTIKSV